MLKDKLHTARRILSRGWVVVVALAWLVAPVGVADVVPLIGAAKAQTTVSDPETLRAALRGVLETQQETAVMIGSTDAQETIARALEQLEQLTWEDLVPFEGLEGRVSDLQAKQDDLNEQLKVLEGYIPNLGEVVQQSSQHFSALPQSDLTAKNYIGLTNAGYGAICSSNPFGSPPNGPNRSNPDTNQGLVTAITVSDAALVVAEGVRDGFAVGCNTVAVVAGFGGNPQNLGCVATAAVYIAAKVINEGLKISFRLLTFCDATIDGAEIEGAFERASDIYDQNVDLDADLAAHDANIDADLAAHDADVKAILATIQAGIAANRERIEEAIRLLHVPQGRRSSTFAVCDGAPCDFPAN